MPTRFVKTQVFSLVVTEQDEAIVSAYFADDNDPCASCADDTPLLKQAENELIRYANGTLTEFTVPVNPKGTPFMQGVWKQLKEIPYASTRTYKEIAALCGNPKATRAVGMACNRNPIAVIIPCHRVVGSGGALTGFAAGLETKERLLTLEAQHKNGGGTT